jgi:glutamate-1-semialdehyde 2,1-aminomutase
MSRQGPKSHEFFQKAQQVMPYGVSSNYRYYGDWDTLVVAKAEGCYLYDFDGKRYIDYRLGWGPIILGHADPAVNARVKEAIDNGVSFAATQPYEVSVAERIIALCPGVDLVRFSNTGSEATMHALRLARGYTGRDIVLKFEGSYHGAHDYVLWTIATEDPADIGPRHQPLAKNASLGVPNLMRELIQLCPWNDVEILGDMLQKRGHEIAAIIVEPVLGNGCALVPAPGYLEFLRQQCDEYGIVLIFDEVKTGFRIAPGGAREFFNVIPDISTYAKALGNGYPIAALAGKKEIMMTLGPGKVFYGGTYSGNVVSTAAADATLEAIQSGRVFARLNKIGGMLMAGLAEVLTRYDIPHVINGAPALFGVALTEKQPRDWRDLHDLCDFELYEKIAEYLIQHGVLPEPIALEPFFLCAAHSEADVAETLQQFEDGVKFVLKK